jgi:ABC-2 type transport system permease protein
MTGELRYEWVRISTVRSTWALIGLAMLVPAGLALFVSWLVGTLGPDEAGPPDGSGGGLSGFLPLTAAVLCAIGAAAFGQEYRHGLIRITLATFPRRTPVFLAKTLMVAGVIVVGAILAIAMIVLAQALGGVIAGTGATWDQSAWGASGIRAVLYIVLFVLMALAITALTRNQPVGIITPIVLAVLVEPIIGAIAFVQGWTWMDWVLPFSGGAAAVATDGAEAWGHLAVFGAWFLAIAIPAWILFVRRDA